MIDGDEFKILKGLQSHYLGTLGTEQAKPVIADLRDFCFMTRTHDGDPAMEGRRQVFLRIMQMLEIPVENIYQYAYLEEDND